MDSILLALKENFKRLMKDYGCQNMVKPVKKILLKHPKNAYQNQEKINKEASKLNYLGNPDFGKSCTDFDLFIRDGKFYAKRYRAISSMFDNYQLNTSHTFSNLIRGMSYVYSSNEKQVFEFKELGLDRLNKNNSNTISWCHLCILDRLLHFYGIYKRSNCPWNCIGYFRCNIKCNCKKIIKTLFRNFKP